MSNTKSSILQKKRKLALDLDSDSDEDTTTIPLEAVNKIIYDYLQKIGYQHTAKAMLEEKPVHLKNKNITTDFVQRVVLLQQKSKTKEMGTQTTHKQIKITTAAAPSSLQLPPMVLGEDKIEMGNISKNEVMHKIEQFKQKNGIKSATTTTTTTTSSASSSSLSPPSASSIASTSSSSSAVSINNVKFDNYTQFHQYLEKTLISTAIDERLLTIEQFISPKSVPKDVFKRIQSIEEKIIEIEEKQGGMLSGAPATNPLMDVDSLVNYFDDSNALPVPSSAISSINASMHSSEDMEEEEPVMPVDDDDEENNDALAQEEEK